MPEARHWGACLKQRANLARPVDAEPCPFILSAELQKSLGRGSDIKVCAELLAKLKQRFTAAPDFLNGPPFPLAGRRDEAECPVKREAVTSPGLIKPDRRRERPGDFRGQRLSAFERGGESAKPINRLHCH
jgi:hypothetical protein